LNEMKVEMLYRQKLKARNLSYIWHYVRKRIHPNKFIRNDA
jgi:hypothetical protein